MLAFLKSAGAGWCSTVCFPFLQLGTRLHILGHDDIPNNHDRYGCSDSFVLYPVRVPIVVLSLLASLVRPSERQTDSPSPAIVHS
jgi:hypothetical protein